MRSESMKVTRTLTVIVSLAALFISTGLAVENSSRQPPNVILLLADNLGWKDIGCFGGPVKTPLRNSTGRARLQPSRKHEKARLSRSFALPKTGCKMRSSVLCILFRKDKWDP